MTDIFISRYRFHLNTYIGVCYNILLYNHNIDDTSVNILVTPCSYERAACVSQGAPPRALRRPRLRQQGMREMLMRYVEKLAPHFNYSSAIVIIVYKHILWCSAHLVVHECMWFMEPFKWHW